MSSAEEIVNIGLSYRFRSDYSHTVSPPKASKSYFNFAQSLLSDLNRVGNEVEVFEVVLWFGCGC